MGHADQHHLYRLGDFYQHRSLLPSVEACDSGEYVSYCIVYLKRQSVLTDSIGTMPSVLPPLSPSSRSLGGGSRLGGKKALGEYK